MFKPFLINPPVFFGALVIIAIFLGIGIFLPSQAEAIFGGLQQRILSGFGWLYLLAVGIILTAMLLLCFSRYGDLKLGPDDSTPDFSFISWVAMLFAAGMGIGLMFYGVGEPMTHYLAPPSAQPGSVAAVREAMSVTFLHWGIHAWAIYAVVGLSLAYFGYRYNLPLTIRSGLYPLLKERIDGPIGHAVDIFAIVGTVFGLATSMGAGVTQINAGLSFLLGLPNGPSVQLAIIALVIGLATISVLTGLDKGVRILSELNLFVAILLMLFVLMVGPTTQLLRDFVQNLGLYLDSMVLRTFNIYAYEPTPWIDAWTLFYWAWWISWSPFVGMFIARISRGRTVRQFITAVLFIPAGFTFIWMTVFGNTAIFLDQGVAAGALGAAISQDLSVGLFEFFTYLPFPTVTSTLAILLVAIFFVTSADSGSVVLDTLAAGGQTETTLLQRVFWCAFSGVVAAVLLLAGGLSALQSATIASALPFIGVILALLWSMLAGMRADLAQQRTSRAVAEAIPAYPAAGLTWQKRLGLILHAPTEPEVRTFIAEQIHPALAQVAKEFLARGQDAQVEEGEDGAIALRSGTEGLRDFVYGVLVASHPVAVLSSMAAGKPETRYEARTYFSTGERGYDVMGMTRDQVITDVLVQFERYMSLTHSPDVRLMQTAPEHDGS
jgi:choline/glycine/proline betaine transport protein